MKRSIVKLKKSRVNLFLKKHKKYAPLLFFIAGFTWDSFTLGRIDRLYDIVILCTYMCLLTLSIYFFNLVGNKKRRNSFLKKYGNYLPLAIQFFLGGLTSAYVIYFSRSVSLSKTASFFVILVIVLFANEFFKKRISNKYFQFCAYYFVNFTFFSFFLPLMLKEMNTTIFLISGAISLVSTFILVTLVYRTSDSARVEIVKRKMMFMIFAIYLSINMFYYFKLIPPVPLALDKGVVAYNIDVKNGYYEVTYEVDDWYVFWRDHKINFSRYSNKPVYVFTSIFAPTDLKKKIYHQWKWYNNELETWENSDKIGFEIIGGRDNGYRGYSYKENVKDGEWKVEVITDEDLVLGVVDFNISTQKAVLKPILITKMY
ncbi:DUF2914 domain-containing protein [Polaribacter glomeratus]|uniref:DUF2914 domain-containing protein n=1 Tax=Polaribacter glomeratus TaxID=102 RepID=A0A2S7WY20_9FLAO|nr:DUF2914 domain-containing protein [Polaribacter glomeratus]PQJ82477.1 hypothetical protein BTO16_07750 [Polaribacter glomeratus]TXD64285.1 DUF2914 domain-containing protein [Polaribacter glomeratus]